MTIFRSLAPAVIALLSACASAQETGQFETRLYAANFSGHVSVFNTDTDELIDVIELGGMVDDVVGSPDGRTVYANLWITEDHKFLPNYGELVAISTEDHEILWRMPLRDGWPHHISISPDGKYIYSPVFDRAYINVVDLERQEVVRTIDGVLGMHGTKLTKDGKRLYVGAMTMESLVVFDTESGDVLQSIDYLGGVRPFDFTEDETTLYTQLSRLHGFAVTDLTTGEQTDTVHLPRRDADTALPESWPHTFNHGLEITPDESLLLVAASIEDFVGIYSLPDLTPRAIVPICDEPNWISIMDDSRKAYISCQGSGEVSVVDIRAQTEVKRMGSNAQNTVRMRLVDVPVVQDE